MATSSQTYYGENRCQKEGCRNKAYYLCNELNVCGVHSKKGPRSELPHRPADQAKQLKEQQRQREDEIIEQAHLDNERAGRRGQVVLSRLLMMREPESIPGFRKVFPNYKHQNRTDGFGCRSLSPMFLGPVKHGQPGLPDALNIENFHQSGKVFREEVDAQGNPTALYYENRLKFYLDPVPHRHKYSGTEKNKNIPLYFIWVDKTGQEHRLNYIESRQFYCTFYERLAMVQPDFQQLQQMLDNGYNLQICGYDARPINRPIMEEYLDPSRPFGHELVLYTLLTHQPQDYPWRKHQTFEF